MEHPCMDGCTYIFLGSAPSPICRALTRATWILTYLFLSSSEESDHSLNVSARIPTACSRYFQVDRNATLHLQHLPPTSAAEYPSTPCCTSDHNSIGCIYKWIIKFDSEQDPTSSKTRSRGSSSERNCEGCSCASWWYSSWPKRVRWSRWWTYSTWTSDSYEHGRNLWATSQLELDSQCPRSERANSIFKFSDSACSIDSAPGRAPSRCAAAATTIWHNNACTCCCDYYARPAATRTSCGGTSSANRTPGATTHATSTS